MSVDVTVEVTGLNEALRVVGRLDKDLRRQLTKDFERAAAPMVEEAISRLPTQPPLSGWARNWKGKKLWAAPDRKGVKAKLSSKRPRGRFGADEAPIGALWIMTKTRGTAILDMTGKANKPTTPQGETLIQQLKSAYGAPSRVMWPSALSTIDSVQNNLKPVINKVILRAQQAVK